VWKGGLESLLAALQHAGATIEVGPVERVGGRDHGHASGPSVYTRDPDANLLEFIVYDRPVRARQRPANARAARRHAAPSQRTNRALLSAGAGCAAS
jgi:hypothetical protein